MFCLITCVSSTSCSFSEVSEELSDVDSADSVELVLESAVSSAVFFELSVSLVAVVELSVV